MQVDYATNYGLLQAIGRPTFLSNGSLKRRPDNGLLPDQLIYMCVVVVCWEIYTKVTAYFTQ
jgi:hypothetical protein